MIPSRITVQQQPAPAQMFRQSSPSVNAMDIKYLPPPPHRRMPSCDLILPPATTNLHRSQSSMDRSSPRMSPPILSPSGSPNLRMTPMNLQSPIMNRDMSKTPELPYAYELSDINELTMKLAKAVQNNIITFEQMQQIIMS